MLSGYVCYPQLAVSRRGGGHEAPARGMAPLHQVAARKRLRFWPAALRRPSMFTSSCPRNLKRRDPRQSFASAKSGSAQTCRLRITLAYGSVAWQPRTCSRQVSSRLRVTSRPKRLSGIVGNRALTRTGDLVAPGPARL